MRALRLARINGRRAQHPIQRPLTLWLPIVLALAVAAVSAATIRSLNTRALDEEHEVTQLAEVHARSYALLFFVEEIYAEGLSDELHGKLHEQVSAGRTILDELVRTDDDNQGMHRLAAVFIGLHQSIDDEVGLIEAGLREDAEAIHHDLIDLGFADLETALLAVQQASRAEARALRIQADLGTLAALLFAALTIAVLVTRFARAQREVAVADVRAVHEASASARSLVQNSSDLVLVINLDQQLRFVSDASQRMLDTAAAALVGQPLFSIVHPEDEGAVRRAIADTLADSSTSPTVECRLGMDGTTWRHVEIVLANLQDDRFVRGIVLNARDVTDRRALERQLAHQALHDPLTSLANRRLFVQRLEHALANAGATVLFLDLDGFKAINDSLGHAAGDNLLVHVAQRLHATLRPSDTIARLGGDEFAVLLEGAVDSTEAIRVATRLGEALAQPIALRTREVTVAASVGIASSHEGTRTANDILGDADLAMYVAKSRGPGHIQTFEATMRTTARERFELDMELRGAVERNEFRVRYQPIVRAGNRQVRGFEALVRWQPAGSGEIPPARFIPPAEETGLIVPIGRYVLRSALREAATWPDDLIVSVNLSARQLQDAALVDDVRMALHETGMPAGRLELEITETAAMQDEERSARRLAELKQLGVRIAVDDFGTGYSSLGYLQRFAIDLLKIDRSFVKELGSSPRESSFVAAIVEMAHALGLEVVAEGVESEEQLKLLQSLGCDLAQGYLFARPLLPDDARALAHRTPSLTRTVAIPTMASTTVLMSVAN